VSLCLTIGGSGWDISCEFGGWNLPWFEKMADLHSIFSNIHPQVLFVVAKGIVGETVLRAWYGRSVFLAMFSGHGKRKSIEVALFI
jgi:hypothetical protein